MFLQHLTFAGWRQRFVHRRLPNDKRALAWACQQNAESEEVLRRVICDGPEELISLLDKLTVHFHEPQFSTVLHDRFHAPERTSNVEFDSAWCDAELVPLRYWWYDMLTPVEQAFIINGDWAISSSPTTDFSMGVAQWWRALESVLKRGIAEPLSELFATHPEWADQDLKNLSDRERRREAVFLDRLAQAHGAARLTLGDLVLVLEKCASHGRPGNASTSRLRREASQAICHRVDALRPQQSNWLNPPHLTQANVDYFRNRASHDGAIEFVDAAVGRCLAKRVLNEFFRQEINTRERTPMIVEPVTIRAPMH